MPPLFQFHTYFWLYLYLYNPIFHLFSYSVLTIWFFCICITLVATSFPTSYQLLCRHLYSPICYLISYFLPTVSCVCIRITLFVLFVCTICTYYCTVECKDPPIAIPMSQFKGVSSKCLLNLTLFDGNTVFYDINYRFTKTSICTIISETKILL